MPRLALRPATRFLCLQDIPRVFLHREISASLYVPEPVYAALAQAAEDLPTPHQALMVYGFDEGTGAIDVTLCSIEGIEIWMGVPVYATCAKARTEAENLDDVARRCRNRLRDVMENAGFQNDPDHWWRFTWE